MLEIMFKAYSALPDQIGSGDAPLVVMPFIVPELAKRSAVQLARRAGMKGLLYAVYDDRRLGFVAMMNAVFRRSSAPTIAYVAQDSFAGRNWLAIGSAALAQKDGGLLAFNDGKWNGALAAFGLASRAWALKNYDGDFFLPEYRRHYADAELTIIAMQQQLFRYDPAALMVEVDWDKEGQSTEPADRTLYHLRARSHYDGKVRNPGLLRLFS
jgi:hypothetical protein